MEYKKGNFIQLSNRKVGIVLSVSRHKITIIDQGGNRRHVSIEEISGKKDNKYIRAKNFQNEFKLDDFVRVRGGLHKNMTGTVKQIHGDILFLFNKEESIRTNGNLNLTRIYIIFTPYNRYLRGKRQQLHPL